MTTPQRTLVLFNHDWDAIAHQRLARTQGLVFDEDGFDLFSFPAMHGWLGLTWLVLSMAWRAGPSEKAGPV